MLDPPTAPAPLLPVQVSVTESACAGALQASTAPASSAAAVAAPDPILEELAMIRPSNGVPRRNDVGPLPFVSVPRALGGVENR